VQNFGTGSRVTWHVALPNAVPVKYRRFAEAVVFYGPVNIHEHQGPIPFTMKKAGLRSDISNAFVFYAELETPACGEVWEWIKPYQIHPIEHNRVKLE